MFGKQIVMALSKLFITDPQNGGGIVGQSGNISPHNK